MSRVETCITQRVPCAFAPTKNGRVGKHTVTVVLSNFNELLSLSCECLKRNGPAVQAIHEMGNEYDTCYSVVASFENMVSYIKESDSLLDDKSILTQLRLSHQTMLQVAAEAIWKHAVNVHNERIKQPQAADSVRKLHQSRLRKMAMLTKIANRVASKAMGLEPEVHHGHGTIRVQPSSYVISETRYYQLFDVRIVPMDNDITSFIMTIGSDRLPFARRSPAGVWDCFGTDELSDWASRHNSWSNTDLGASPTRCTFCAESFDRISRHIAGAAHITRVLDIANHVLRATSRFGLQMLNNPNHQHIFL